MVKARFLKREFLNNKKIGILEYKGAPYIDMQSFNSIFKKYKKDGIISKINLFYTEDFKKLKQGYFVRIDKKMSVFQNNPIVLNDILSFFEKNKLEFNRADFVLSKKNFNYVPKKKQVQKKARRNIYKTYPITILAKEYGLSALKMNQLLYSLGVQYKAGGKWNVYSPYETLALTSMNYKRVNGVKQFCSVHWTQKGFRFIENYLYSLGIEKIKFVDDKKKHLSMIDNIIKSDEKILLNATEFWLRQMLE